MSENNQDDKSIDTPDADAAAYVLNALSPQERAEFEERARTSEATRDEVIDLRDTAAQLGLAVQPVQPSADLKANLMAKLAQTPQLPREQAADASPQPAATEPVSESAASASLAASPGPIESGPTGTGPTGTGPIEGAARARWFSRPAGLLAAAAVAAALFLGGTLVGQTIVRNDFEVAQATALAQLQTAADARQASAEVAGGGEATLIWSPEQGRSVVMINGLEPLPEGETYQLWYIGESGPISAGTFEAAESGSSWRVLDGTMSAGDTVGVTVEPEGGSEQPTTDPVVAIPSA
jgi:anti-sigma-K factor RskA